MVRLRRNGVAINKFYSDANHGGKRAALQSARAAREELEVQYGPAVSSTKNMLTTRNTTGVVGVHVGFNRDGRYQNAESYSYCASWTSTDGERLKISFGFLKYGQVVAWELACIARKNEITDRAKVIALHDARQRRAAKKSISARPTVTPPAPKAVTTKKVAKPKASVKKAIAVKTPAPKKATKKVTAKKSVSKKAVSKKTARR